MGYKQYNPSPCNIETHCKGKLTPKVWSSLGNNKKLDKKGKWKEKVNDKVLYVPEMSKQLFSLITAGYINNKSETMRWGTSVSQNNIAFTIS